MIRILVFLALAGAALAQQPKVMLWGDTSRLGRPFSKDPSVIRVGGRYLLYYSMPPFGDKREGDGWGIGIAESRNLIDWKKVGELLPADEWEKKGICAPFARLIDGQVHLFYQTYGNGPKDSICHATSRDGLKFTRDASNPIFHPTGEWNSGRAIDAEVVKFQGKWFLYSATRDAASKIQMLTAAVSSAGFGRDAWKMAVNAPILKPELDWEQQCIEAPATVEHNGSLYLFYGGAYNNAPQQIGCARSRDGITWERVAAQPLLPVGAPGSWNSSESGHPATFVDRNGQLYLFYQGNNDKGRTWQLSNVRIAWKGDTPYVVQP